MIQKHLKQTLIEMTFRVIDDGIAQAMRDKIDEAKNDGVFNRGRSSSCS